MGEMSATGNLADGLWNSLHYACNFSVCLKLYQNKKL